MSLSIRRAVAAGGQKFYAAADLVAARSAAKGGPELPGFVGGLSWRCRNCRWGDVRSGLIGRPLWPRARNRPACCRGVSFRFRFRSPTVA